MTSRDDILARVRAAVAGADQVDLPAAPSDPLADVPADTALDTFCDRIADYRATIDRVRPADVATAVAAACATHHVGTLLTSAGVPTDWCADLPDAGVTTVADTDDLPATALDDIDGVLSGASVAIAETGTIVLDGGPAQGRRMASLVPDVHICVVRADQLVGGGPAAGARLDGRPPLTWISGGSATSDIELNRVEGVHGPRTLHVLLIER
jgi:L-lactate dehydrogenase complex protein LldG